MPRFCLIVLFLLLRSQPGTAQTGYKEVDTVKYTKSEIITNVNGFITIVFYKDKSIHKIISRFNGSSFSSINIYYMLNNQLIHNVYASLRKPHDYIEEHMYFKNGKMNKWVNTKNKEIDPNEPAFSDKEKLVLNFFEKDLKEVKTKKPVR